MNSLRLLALSVSLALIAVAAPQLGCDAAKEATDDFVEGQLGCTPAQLEGVDEPDLPDCSRVAACCKFVSGDCGQVRFTPHPDVKAACDANEAVLATVISSYRAIDGEQCPAVLQASACEGGVDQTKAKFVEAVNDGVRTSASQESPSCRRISKETIGRLDETIGDAAEYLPEACSALTIDKEPIAPDSVAGGEGEGEGEAGGPDPAPAGGEGEGEGEG